MSDFLTKVSDFFKFDSADFPSDIDFSNFVTGNKNNLFKQTENDDNELLDVFNKTTNNALTQNATAFSGFKTGDFSQKIEKFMKIAKPVIETVVSVASKVFAGITGQSENDFNEIIKSVEIPTLDEAVEKFQAVPDDKKLEMIDNAKKKGEEAFVRVKNFIETNYNVDLDNVDFSKFNIDDVLKYVKTLDEDAMASAIIDLVRAKFQID